jgi:hypothetical protein
MTSLPAIPRQIRGSVALAAAILLSAMAIAYAGQTARDQAQAERNAAAASLENTSSRLRQMDRDREEAVRLSALFLDLQTRGLVGDPAIPEWAESMEDIRREMGLPALHYESLPSAGSGEQSFDFHITSLRLRLQLLHEGDLLGFLERLQREAKALVLPRACRLTRAPAGSPANLSADCEVDWARAYGKVAADHE